MPGSGRFLRNIAWSSVSVLLNLFTGIFVSRYSIVKMGDEGYGVWVLAFSLIENYWLFDLGVRSATVRFSAHYNATGERAKLNELLNTALLFLGGAGLVLVGVTLGAASLAHRLFNVSEAYRDVLSYLIVIVGLNWSVGLVSNAFNATLEGFQRFDLSSRMWMAVTALRAFGTVAVLGLGYGIRELAIVVSVCQWLGYLWTFFNFRKVFPEFRFSPSLATRPMFIQIRDYAVHTLTATVGQQILWQSPGPLVGFFLPAAQVGYYAVPNRLLQMTTVVVDRVMAVTGSTASEMSARGDWLGIPVLAATVNRYCVALLMPLCLMFGIYGRELLLLWIPNPAYAAQSAPLLPWIAAGYLIATAGQGNSSAILFGLSRHRGYARSLLVEALLMVAALCLVLPRYGILGGAIAVSVLMAANRGLVLSFLATRALQYDWMVYLRSIYLRPILTAVPVCLALIWLKSTVLPAHRWIELAAAAVAAAASYYALAAITCVEPRHRARAREWIARKTGAPASHAENSGIE